MNIVLTGFMAAGKTEISKAIAAMSSYTLYDTDDMIEKNAVCLLTKYLILTVKNISDRLKKK